jgi:hypothetical protein
MLPRTTLHGSRQEQLLRPVGSRVRSCRRFGRRYGRVRMSASCPPSSRTVRRGATDRSRLEGEPGGGRRWGRDQSPGPIGLIMMSWGAGAPPRAHTSRIRARTASARNSSPCSTRSLPSIIASRSIVAASPMAAVATWAARRMPSSSVTVSRRRRSTNNCSSTTSTTPAARRRSARASGNSGGIARAGSVVTRRRGPPLRPFRRSASRGRRAWPGWRHARLPRAPPARHRPPPRRSRAD